MARARPAAAVAAVQPGPVRRRRRTGLAVVVVVGALATGGAAGAATGHLPGPVREVARSLLGTGGGQAPSASTDAGQPPAPVKRPAGAGGGLPGSRLGVATSRGLGAGPNLEGLCQAFLSGTGAEQGGKLDATAFEALARAAGGQERVPAYCQDLLPGDQKPKEPKEPKQPEPAGSGGQGQSGPPATSGSGGQGQGNQGQGNPPDPSSPSPSPNR